MFKSLLGGVKKSLSQRWVGGWHQQGYVVNIRFLAEGTLHLICTDRQLPDGDLSLSNGSEILLSTSFEALYCWRSSRPILALHGN